MATKLRWNDYYQPMTPIGQGFQTIAAGLFNGPGAGELAAGQAEAEFKRAQMAKTQAETLDLQDKARGRTALGQTFADAARFAPDLRPRPLAVGGTLSENQDAPPVTFDRPAAQATAQEFFGRMPINLAEQAMRSGVDIKQAADANVLAKSSDYFGDAARMAALVGTGKTIRPYDAFSEKGQLGAERRETSDKIAVTLAPKYFDAAQGNTANERKFAELDMLRKKGRISDAEYAQATAQLRNSMTQAAPQSDLLKKQRDLDAIKAQYGENSPEYKSAFAQVNQSQTKVTVEGARLQSLSNDGVRATQAALTYVSPTGDIGAIDKQKLQAIALADTYSTAGQLGTLTGRIAGVDPAATTAALRMRAAIATKLYIQSGAAITMQEAERQASFYMPKVTDAYDVQQQKVRDLHGFFSDSANIAKIVNHGALPTAPSLSSNQPAQPGTPAPTQPGTTPAPGNRIRFDAQGNRIP